MLIKRLIAAFPVAFLLFFPVMGDVVALRDTNYNNEILIRYIDKPVYKCSRELSHKRFNYFYSKLEKNYKKNMNKSLPSGLKTVMMGMMSVETNTGRNLGKYGGLGNHHTKDSDREIQERYSTAAFFHLSNKRWGEVLRDNNIISPLAMCASVTEAKNTSGGAVGHMQVLPKTIMWLSGFELVQNKARKLNSRHQHINQLVATRDNWCLDRDKMEVKDNCLKLMSARNQVAESFPFKYNKGKNKIRQYFGIDFPNYLYPEHSMSLSATFLLESDFEMTPMGLFAGTTPAPKKLLPGGKSTEKKF